jgi:ribosomal protein L14E/L6E/L27E
MKEEFSVGDIVKSIAGRDVGIDFLVVNVDGDNVYLVNGRDRKIQNPKKKNKKHLRKVLTAEEKELAERILGKVATGNERVYRAIKAKKQKIQED